jgi:hypothetical protein
LAIRACNCLSQCRHFKRGRSKKLKIGVYVFLSPQEFDCHICTDNQKKGRGCNDVPQSPYTIDGKELDRCPRRYYTPEVGNYIFLYQHYEKGHLFIAGGVADQPHKYLLAMQMIGSEIEKTQREIREREAKHGKV